MRPAPFQAVLATAALLAGLGAAPLAVAGGHGYPPTVHSMSGEVREHGWSSEREWSGQYDGSGERPWSDDRYDAGAHAWSFHDRADLDDGFQAPVVGYLPVSFFADAGGVGPYAIDGGYGGGGVYVYGGGSAGGFAGARASASASASVSIHGGFHGGHGGGFHHGCGCK
jgi:hypothetical protein